MEWNFYNGRKDPIAFMLDFVCCLFYTDQCHNAIFLIKQKSIYFVSIMISLEILLTIFGSNDTFFYKTKQQIKLLVIAHKLCLYILPVVMRS